MLGDVTMIENVPVELNLGQPETVMGIATLTKDLDSGLININIEIREGGGMEQLDELVEMFEIRTLGFSGRIKVRPEDGR